MFNIFMIRFKSISHLIACSMWKEKIRSNIYIIGMAVGLALVGSLFVIPLHEHW